MAIQTGTRSPVKGLTAFLPVSTPSFSVSPMSRRLRISATVRATQAPSSFSFGPATRSGTIGCSAETTRKVAPQIVSMRVVKTSISFEVPSRPKRTWAPVLRPIQFFCIWRTCSGHLPSAAWPVRSSSA